MDQFWFVLGGWVSAGLTLFIFSFLYKDNPLFKIAEHLYVGVTIGYSLVIYYYQAIVPKVVVPVGHGDLMPLVPTLLGLAILTRFFPKVSWISRFSFAFIMGYSAGLAIPTAIVSRFLKQMEGTIGSLVLRTGGSLDFSWGAVGQGLSLLILTAGLLAVLIYFFFSVEHAGPLKAVSRVGIYFIMVYLGAAFGTTIMGRFSLLYGRMFDLYTFRTGQYYYATPVLAALVVIFLAIYELKLAKD